MIAVKWISLFCVLQNAIFSSFLLRSHHIETLLWFMYVGRCMTRERSRRSIKQGGRAEASMTDEGGGVLFAPLYVGRTMIEHDRRTSVCVIYGY